MIPSIQKRTFASHAPTLLVGACCIALDALVIGLCIQARSSAPIVSPWDVLPIWIFGVFGLATALLAYGVRVLPRGAQTALFVLHAATAWLTAVIIYRLGFGFDPFIHQAAEQHLVTYGSITLTSPLYIGQYALVWLLQKISGFSVIQIDQWLLPLLSLGLIPLLQRTRRLLPLALFLLPISWFSFTIPFHLALLCFLGALCLSENINRPRDYVLLSACGVLSLLIHPLVGIPCALFVGGILLEKTRWQQLASFVPAVGIPLGLIAAFAGYAALQKASLSLPSFESLLTSLSILFGTPYRLSTDALGLSLLYGFLSLWPLAISLIGLRQNLQNQTPGKRYRRMTAFGLFTAAVLLACFVRLPDIIAHEQFEFPLRLLRIVPLLFLPDVADWLEGVLLRKTKRAHWIALGSALGIGLIATTQWFVSYPQNNKIISRYAPSVSEHEYAAIDWIDQQRQGQPFVVLSHQMLAAAALQQQGFEQTITTCHGTHLSYAIPTGGALYEDFLRLIRTVNTPQVLEVLKDCYGRAQVFVVIPVDWDPQGTTDVRLAPLSEKTTILGDHLRGYKIQ